jgi:hypothetical protein
MDMRQASVDLQPVAIWDAPHSFAREGSRVFSYGLLLPEADRVRIHDARERLASRWGKVEVEELARNLVPAARGRGDTVTFDASTVNLLAPFVRALKEAADATTRVPEGFADDLKRFLDLAARPDRFVWRWREGADGWIRVRTPRYDSLFERLAIEFDHLASLRPRLGRCTLCGRVFVPLRPGRPERHCRANLWLEAARPPRRLERCVPLDETERVRVKKRLDQRYRRALARTGDHRHPDVVAAKRALGEWSRKHPPAQRGKQPRPTPGLTPETPEMRED